jgi:hypothetical protein
MEKNHGQPQRTWEVLSGMPESKGNDAQRTLAVRVTPDYHAQLAMVAQIDDMSLTDLFMAALDSYMVQRREAPDFQARAAQALADAEAQMARTRAMLLGALPDEVGDAGADSAPTGRRQRKDEASG